MTDKRIKTFLGDKLASAAYRENLNRRGLTEEQGIEKLKKSLVSSKESLEKKKKSIVSKLASKFKK